MKLEERCREIRLILSDVDGVLTDGGIIYNNDGIETKQFNIRDGLGIKLWQKAGYRFGILTARNSQIVRVRAAELGVSLVRQGCEDKLPACQEIIRQEQLTPEQVCYIGDDLGDIPVIRYVGLGVCVADAVNEARSAADHVVSTPGGRGAVRELVETLLKSQDRWDDLIRKYVS